MFTYGDTTRQYNHWGKKAAMVNFYGKNSDSNKKE